MKTLPGQRGLIPARASVLAGPLLTPLAAAACYAAGAFLVFLISLPPAGEAGLLGLLWLTAAAACVYLGSRDALRAPRREPDWLVASSASAVVIPLIATPLLSPDWRAGLVAVLLWALALVALALTVGALVRRFGVAHGAIASITGGLILVLLAVYLLARLQLPAEDASWVSAPWWLPVSVTDHALVDSSLVNRVDAVRIGAGMSVLSMLATAYVLGYVISANVRWKASRD